MVILNSTNMLPLVGLCFAPRMGTNLAELSYQAFKDSIVCRRPG